MKSWWVAGATALLAAAAVPADAARIVHVRTESGVDWTSAGVGGLGGGSGTITLSGVTGTVRKAFLYWHGIDSGGNGVYDNETIDFNGSSITGQAIGDATTNCWGFGSSRAFRANVTSLVSGDGDYSLSGLSAKTGHNANGASLVVIFDDGNPDNDRDLVFFEGNDSNWPEGFPGEDDGWNATLDNIDYQGGTVGAQLHVADGQDFLDEMLTFASNEGTTFTIDDTAELWDGISVPTAGTSRAGNGELWDIHSFDFSKLFSTFGAKTLTMSGQFPPTSDDCLGLVLLLLDLQAGSAPQPQPPAISIDDVQVVEGDFFPTTAFFTVTLSAPTTEEVTVSFRPRDVSAVFGVDYCCDNGKVRFPPFFTQQFVAFVVCHDFIFEGDESFEVVLSNPVNATIAKGVGVATILDDDDRPQASVSDVTVVEGRAGKPGNAVFTVRLSRPSARTVRVGVSTADGTATAGQDYVPLQTTVRIRPGRTSKKVSVTLVGDRKGEPEEDFFLELGAVDASAAAQPRARATIQDDD